MNTIPRFNLGDSVSVRINNRIVLGTISPYNNGVMVIHDDSLEYAEERDFTYNTPRQHNRYTADGQLYAQVLGNNVYYVVRLVSGENIIQTERNLVVIMGTEGLRRNMNNNQSRRNMEEFLSDDTRPYLPDAINDNIMSYLTETPLSTNINTRIQNRLNPPTPSRAHVHTISERRAESRAASRRWNDEITREREREARRLSDEQDRIRRQADNVVKAKAAQEWLANRKSKKGGKTKKSRKTKKSKTRRGLFSFLHSR